MIKVKERLFPKHGFLLLLLFLVGMILVQPFFYHSVAQGRVSVIFFTAVLLAAVQGCSGSRRLLWAGIAFSVPALVLSWATLFWPDLDPFRVTFQLLFFTYICCVFFQRIFLADSITLDLLFGAFCLYLLIGLLWALAYTLLEQVFPGSFAGTQMEEAGSLADRFLYYSYVTLTTLGYGDIIPATPPARNLSALEALTGQFYIAILVARLLGLHLQKR